MYSQRCFVKPHDANTLEYVKRPPLTEPTTIRVTEPQKAAIERMAKELGHSKAADAYRHVLDLGFRWLAGERPDAYGETPATLSSGATVNGEDFATLPLVAEGVAAGFGVVAEVLDEPRPYAFRADWPALQGMAADPLRFVLFRLRDDADSMAPEIRPGALVLCDRSEGVRISPRNGVPYLVVTERPDHVAVKRVLPVRDGEKIRALVYHSTNPHYQPVSIDLKRGERIQDLVRARVVWWATTVE